MEIRLLEDDSSDDSGGVAVVGYAAAPEYQSAPISVNPNPVPPPPPAQFSLSSLAQFLLPPPAQFSPPPPAQFSAPPPQQAAAVGAQPPPQQAASVGAQPPPQQAAAVGVQPPPQQADSVGTQPPPQQAAAVGAQTPMTEEVPAKRKRGRPRKYNPDGSLATSARFKKPISTAGSAPPPVIDFSSGKRPRVNEPKEKSSYEFVPANECVTRSVSNNFTTHVLRVDSGQDILMHIMGFILQGPRATCVLSANGFVSAVTLRLNTAGTTITYDGHFELISLTGSFVPTKNGATGKRSGAMSVSFVDSKGIVAGGGVAGRVVAAAPVEVVVASFLPGDRYLHEPKKEQNNDDSFTATTPPGFAATPPGFQTPISVADPNAGTSSQFQGGNQYSTPSGSRSKQAKIVVLDD